MKKLIFVFALCIVCLTQTGLTQNTVAAFASQHGIYLKLENDYPTFTPGVYPEYIIERKNGIAVAGYNEGRSVSFRLCSKHRYF